MTSHYNEPLADHLVQVMTDILSDELDILTATDDQVYNKIAELAKLCSDKFYKEDHLDEEEPSELEYRDMDEFPAEVE